MSRLIHVVRVIFDLFLVLLAIVCLPLIVLMAFATLLYDVLRNRPVTWWGSSSRPIQMTAEQIQEMARTGKVTR